MAAAPTYITHVELKRIFPQLDEFDQKTQIFGWATGISDFDSETGINVSYAHDTGLVNTLFFNGAKILKTTYRGGSSTTQGVLNGAMTDATVEFNLDAGHSIGVGDIIKIDSEYIRVTAIAGNTITTTLANRGLFDTSAVAHANDSSVYIIIDEDGDLGNATSGGLDALGFVYDVELDLCLLITTVSEVDNHLVEAGEDFTTMVTQYRADASRYFDSRVDPSLPREQLKDKSGNYDYMVIRTVGLIAACFMMKTKDHNSPVAASFMEEAENNIALLNEGKAALSWQNTSDASQGIIRDVAYTSGRIRPVDTRGEWSGTWDLIKLEIEDAGAIGTATYNVWVKDSDGLKNNKVVDSEKITGDFQPLAGGLQVRFAGEEDNSTAHADGEWEIEVTGKTEYVDSSDMKAIKLTRTGTPARRYYK
jgi:hypothetical protein